VEHGARFVVAQGYPKRSSTESYIIQIAIIFEKIAFCVVVLDDRQTDR